MTERIVVGATGSWDAPQAKYRLGPLARDGRWPVQLVAGSPFPAPEEIDALLAAGGGGAVLVLQRMLPSARDMRRLRGAYDRIVYDIDDAIYAPAPELAQSSLRRRARALGRLALRGSPTASSRRRPLRRVLRNVDVCVVGSPILGTFAARVAPVVVEIPTTVQPVDAPPPRRPSTPVVVWVGVAANLQYLGLVRDALERLHREVEFRLRVVSSKPWTDAPIPCEFVPWTEEAHRDALLAATVGIAPLTDEPWTRGKCAHRVIQYGGHALAAVASPVGVTDRVIDDGRTGFLARSEADWYRALHDVICSPERAAEMGAAALDRVRERYSDAVALREWTRLIEGLEPAPASVSGRPRTRA